MKLKESLIIVACAIFAAASLALGACSSSTSPAGSILNPQPSPSPSQLPKSLVPTPPPDPTPTPISLVAGQVVGTQVFPNGDTSSGGQGSPISDPPVSCGARVQTFHIHFHLALWHNGQQIAIPTAVGIVNPVITTLNGGPYANQGSCFYNLHTEDSSGVVHIEAADSTTYTLGQFFDIWGEPLTIGNVAGFTGQTLVFDTNEPPTRADVYTGDPRRIVLGNHQNITIEVGGPFVYPLFYTWGY